MSSNQSNDYSDTIVIGCERSSGRVTWDARGNSVWEWQTAPGVYTRDADTQRVKALQIADLELLETPVPSGERVFSVSRNKNESSRVGTKLPERGNVQSEEKPERSGLLRRLIGR